MAILLGQFTVVGFCFRSGVRSVSSSVSTVRARAIVALRGSAASNLLLSFVAPLAGCVRFPRVIHLPVFGKHSRANKAAHRDGLPLTSFAVLAAHGLKRYAFKQK